METIKTTVYEDLLTFIALKIKTRREELNLTQADLATMVGLTRTSITNIERGKSQVQLITLVGIASNLKCTLDYFLPSELLYGNSRIISSKIDYSKFFSTNIDSAEHEYLTSLIENM